MMRMDNGLEACHAYFFSSANTPVWKTWKGIVIWEFCIVTPRFGTPLLAWTRQANMCCKVRARILFGGREKWKRSRVEVFGTSSIRYP